MVVVRGGHEAPGSGIGIKSQRMPCASSARHEDGFNPRLMDKNISLSIPSEFEIEELSQNKHQADLVSFLRVNFNDGITRQPAGAILFAGLHDDPEGASVLNATALNRQWWVDFKRGYYGLDKIYDKPFVCPIRFKGMPAPVVHKGSHAESGMKKDSAKNLDAVCKQWIKDAGEGFNVCVLRHGVIVLHEGYGKSEEKSVSTSTRLGTASATKCLAATLMMEMVDQGLVNWKRPLTKYLPPFRGLKPQRALTVHDLYLHVTGCLKNSVME